MLGVSEEEVQIGGTRSSIISAEMNIISSVAIGSAAKESCLAHLRDFEEHHRTLMG